MNPHGKAAGLETNSNSGWGKRARPNDELIADTKLVRGDGVAQELVASETEFRKEYAGSMLTILFRVGRGGFGWVFWGIVRQAVMTFLRRQ